MINLPKTTLEKPQPVLRMVRRRAQRWSPWGHRYTLQQKWTITEIEHAETIVSFYEEWRDVPVTDSDA